jgi:Mrp family chromosome partitioning ATPase
MNSETIAQPMDIDVAAGWQPDVAVSACFRDLYQRLLLQSAAEGAVRIVGVTSYGRGEGVSTVASRLAVAAAEHNEQRVLLVDANPESRSFQHALTIDRTPGLLNVIRGSHTIDQVLQLSSVENLLILPLGAAFPRSPLIEPPTTVQQLFGSLSLEFSFIVVDMAPVDQLGEVAGVASAVDGIVLVVEAESIGRTRARAVTDLLSRSRVLGAVLNKQQDPR